MKYISSEKYLEYGTMIRVLLNLPTAVLLWFGAKGKRLRHDVGISTQYGAALV